MSKSALAEKFGITTKTLLRRCKAAGIEITRKQMLTASDVLVILTKVGHYEIDNPTAENGV